MLGLLVLYAAAAVAATEPVEASCGSDFSYISRGVQLESDAGELYLRTGNPKAAAMAVLAPQLVPGAKITGVAFSYRYITGYGPKGVGANFSVLVAGVPVYASPFLTNFSYNANRTNYSPPVPVAAAGLDITVPAKGGAVELRFRNNDRNLQMLLPLRFELTCGGACVQGQAWQPPTPTVVFAAGDVDSDGVKCNCFRIPTLIKAPDGELIAFAEGRYASCHPDVRPENRIVMRKSTDKGAGKIWGPIRVIAGKTQAERGCGMNYPSPIVDANTGNIILFFNGGCAGCPRGHACAPCPMWRIDSADSGVTWSARANMTAQQGFAQNLAGGGGGSQLASGRLVYACGAAAPATSSTASKACGLRTGCFSDDGGMTWKRGAAIPCGSNVHGLGEASLIADGRTPDSLVMFVRVGSKSNLQNHAIASSIDAGETWGAAQLLPAIIGPTCQGSIGSGGAAGRLLLSAPFSRDAGLGGRENMAVWELTLNTTAEPTAGGALLPQLLARLYPCKAAYSSFIQTGPGRLNLFEGGATTRYASIMLANTSALLSPAAPVLKTDDDASSGAEQPKHFVVALIDDLGGYNVPWRNPDQKGDDLLQLSTKEGMRLENFYTFKYCSPTRSSLLTARYPAHVNQRNGMPCPGCSGCDGGGIDLRMKLLPEKLKAKKYRSYMVGKGHIGSRSVGHLPINRGFDHHLGFLGGGEDHWQCSGTRHSCDGNASSTNGVKCLCSPKPSKPPKPVDLWQDKQPADNQNGTYSCNLYSGKAVALIEDHAKNYMKQGMFLYLPYHDVHEPYEALDSFRDAGCPDHGRQTMQAMMSCVSEGTGNVTRALKKHGMWKTTLFLWSADNGGPQYWLGNNYPLRGGKGTDFEGGVAAAAFVTGGALPSSLFGKASSSPIHLVDLHFSICLMAGLSDEECRDDDTPGIPPVDGVDLRGAFATLNITRPVAQGAGPSAGTQEIVLSTNNASATGRSCNADLSLCGAFIDFNETNGGPWKYVANTTTVIKNAGSPKGSGYWTPPVWPVGTNLRSNESHLPTVPDPGCPDGGCLFNLRLDRTEHKEYSQHFPEIKAKMMKRMKALMATTFQSDASFTGGYDDCKDQAAVTSKLHGFFGVCCSKGKALKTEDETAVEAEADTMDAKLAALKQLTSAPPAWPFAYDWDKFPAAWFGGNATDFESEAQLEEIGTYSLVIFGWQHMITATNWTASVYAQLEQAAKVKAKFPNMPVYVYTGFGNADGYNNHTAAVMQGAVEGCPNNQPCRVTPEPYTDWFLQTAKTPVYSMSACEQMGLGYSHPPTNKCWNPIWNVGNPKVREFFLEKIIPPLATSPHIDGVFFDCFNFAYDMPTPWNRTAINIPNCSAAKGGAGCDVLLDGAVELAAGIAKALNAGTPNAKVPMYSNPASFVNNGGKTNPPKPAAIWLDEAKLVTALSGSAWQLNYEFMRAELLASTGQLQNLLRESKLGLAAGVHVYYQKVNKTCVPNATATPPVVCVLEDPTPHIAAFLLFRQEHWYFFGSTGWLDQDWKWSKLYDTLSVCGKPVDAVPQGGPNVFTRKYAGCVASVDCSNATACTASVKDGKGRDVLGKGALQRVTGGMNSRSLCRDGNKKQLKSDDRRPALLRQSPGLAPLWEPTFDMALSTTVMPCNNAELMSSGPNWGTIRGYGLIDIDWSNAKQKWINTDPMSCEEDLLKQAQLIKANNTLGASQKVWIYRNAVWAMPWMTHTRKLLDDSAYDVWFLRFKNGSDGRTPLHHDNDGTYKSRVCDDNYSPPKCSALFHQPHSQTPGYPKGDGNCQGPCNCGRVPCGPYLFDHRQAHTKVKGQTLREWFIAEMFLGETGLGSPVVSGFYIDDWWPKADHEHSWPPHMNTSREQWKPPYGNGGAGDMDGSELADIDLSANDVDDLHAAWVGNMKAIVAAIIPKGGFAWQLFNGGGGWLQDVTGYSSTAPWTMGAQGEACAASLRLACQAGSQQQKNAFHYNFDDMNNKTALVQNLAGFLLMRGNYSWFGYGFQGCSKPYYRPPELDVDYGTPLGLCTEGKAGVFTREWTRAQVAMDCNSYQATITPSKFLKN